MTVRERVKAIQVELREQSPVPERAREMLNELTALIGNCNDEAREADADYSVYLLACYDREKKANRAKLVAEVSPQYQRKREAHDVKEVVIEMVRALKVQLRGIEEEMRLSR